MAFAPAVACIALAAVAAQWRALRAPFFADDWLFLDQVRGHSLLTVLGSPDPLGNYFRPLSRQVWFSALDVLGGGSPWVFHAANLVCMVCAVVLLSLIARRAAGPVAGVIAAAFFALHHAFDVPVLWASGAQELLAVTLALAALALHQRGARLAGASVFLLALLAKESVVLAPLAAMALDEPAGSLGSRLRRAVPWFVAVAGWAVIAGLAAAARGTAGAGLQLTATGPLAVPVLLVRVVLGLEWVRGSWVWSHGSASGTAGVIALVVASATVLWTAASVPRSHAAGALPPWRSASRAGLMWALAGAIPVAAMAAQWSAYYFLFAMAGVALALGALLARAPAPLAAAAVLGLGFASNSARGLEQFATAPSAWSGQSHLNRFYLERGMAVMSRGIADLTRQMPAPAPRTTVFVAGLPAFAAFQAADGPLVRCVYRDPTLRSHYLSQLTRERLARGPWRVFLYEQASGRLEDATLSPGLLLRTALSLVLDGQPDAALAALEASAAAGIPEPARDQVWAWVAYETGDHALATQRLQAAGRGTGAEGGRYLLAAREGLAAGDTLRATELLRGGLTQFALDPALHALASDVFMTRPETRDEGVFEAYVARLLSPADPLAWRRWAIALSGEDRPVMELAALDRYAKLDPAASARDPIAQALRAELERRRPGGELAQQGLQLE